MSGILFAPFYAAIDGDGIPMAGAKLYFYTTGTTTPQHTYAASDLVTPNANPVEADADGLFPPIYLAPGPDYKAILKTSADVTVATRDPIEAPQPPVTLPAIRSYLAGLTLSTAGSSTSFSVAAGTAADSTNAVTMNLAAMTKNTNSWASGTGNGSLDTGSIATSSWYHVHLIYRSDTGATDVLTSLSATSPTMPTSYTHRRRIGAMKTDGSGNWTAFVQDGDDFAWKSAVTDITAGNPGISAVTRTLASVPTGIRVKAKISVEAFSGNTGQQFAGLISDLSGTDVTPAFSGDLNFGGLADLNATAGSVTVFVSNIEVWTNTSAQVRSRINTSGASSQFTIVTRGWVDRRGRDA